MYVNGQMIYVETIQGMEGEVMKENGMCVGGKFQYVSNMSIFHIL
jgi:hypothetical protein